MYYIAREGKTLRDTFTWNGERFCRDDYITFFTIKEAQKELAKAQDFARKWTGGLKEFVQSIKIYKEI